LTSSVHHSLYKPQRWPFDQASAHKHSREHHASFSVRHSQHLWTLALCSSLIAAGPGLPEIVGLLSNPVTNIRFSFKQATKGKKIGQDTSLANPVLSVVAAVLA
jgi:hypothetical protein